MRGRREHLLCIMVATHFDLSRFSSWFILFQFYWIPDLQKIIYLKMFDIIFKINQILYTKLFSVTEK